MGTKAVVDVFVINYGMAGGWGQARKKGLQCT
jgi:hypothetical protein